MLLKRLTSIFKVYKKILIVFFVVLAMGAAWLEFVKGDLLYPLRSEGNVVCNKPKLNDGYYMYYNFDEIIVHLASYPSMEIAKVSDYPAILQRDHLKKLLVSQVEAGFADCLTTREGKKKPVTIFDNTSETTALPEFKWVNNNQKLVLRVDVKFTALPDSSTGIGYISYRLYRPGLPLSYPYYYVERSMPYFLGISSEANIIKFIEGVKLEKVLDPGRCYYCTFSD